MPSIENDLEDKAVRGTIAGAICLMILWYCTIQVYITLEMVLLLFIGVSLVLKLVWRGPIDFLKSRNVLTVSTCMAPCMSIHTLSWLPQVLILLVMFAEALAILSRNQRHFRITRALRPYFLLDTYLMAGARRYFVEHQQYIMYQCHHTSLHRIVRQIIKCAKYIIDVMFILFFLIGLASLIGKCYFLCDSSFNIMQVSSSSLILIQQ